MKKLLALILAAMMIFAVVSCGNGDAADTNDTGAASDSVSDTAAESVSDTAADTTAAA